MHRVINMDKCAWVGWLAGTSLPDLALNWGFKRGSPPSLIWVTSSILDFGVWMMESMRKHVDVWPLCGLIYSSAWSFVNNFGGRSRGRSLHLVVKRSSDDNPFQHNWSLTNHRHDW